MGESEEQFSSNKEAHQDVELLRQRERYSGVDTSRLRNECNADRSQINTLEADVANPRNNRPSRVDQKRRLPKLKLELHRVQAHYETSSLLLEDVEEMGDTTEALRTAAARGDGTTVTRLLSRGVDVNRPAASGFTAFQYAVSNGHLDIAKLMITAGQAKVNDPESKTHPLALAASRGHHDVVQLLLDNGATVDVRDEANQTPLLIASEQDHVDCARALLAAKANPNATDSHGNSSLHYAAMNGNASLAQLLMGHGTNGSLHNNQRMTPLAIARTRRHFEVVDEIAKK